MNFKKSVTLIMFSAMLIVTAFSGCKSASSSTVEPYIRPATVAPATADEVIFTAPLNDETELETTTPNTEEYKAVFDEYSNNMVFTTMNILNDIKSAEINAYAKNIANDGREQLATIYNQGLGEFVDIMRNSGTTEEEYDYWVDKLHTIYDQQFNSISSAENNEDYEDRDY